MATQSKTDEMNAKYFHDGWGAALREVVLQTEAGRYVEFMHEQRVNLTKHEGSSDE